MSERVMTPSPVRVGDPAPDVTLLDPERRPVRLADFRGRPVVLFFFPRSFTPACTAEACAFRDASAGFDDAQAVVIGVSGDAPETLDRFGRAYGLTCRLLSDADGAVRRAFGVPRTLGIFPGRVTYVIDAGGVVRRVFSSQLRPGKHVREALSALRPVEGPNLRGERL